MDPGNSCQDVVRCGLCESLMPPLHCDMCYIDLCKACVGEHISDFSKEHRVVQFSERGATPVYPKCSIHSDKACELQCTRCDTPVCTLCVADKHNGHKFWSIKKKYTAQKEDMKRDLEELVKVLCTKYETKASEIESEKSSLEETYKELITTTDKEAEKLHREIDMLVKRRKTEINDMKIQHLAALNEEKEKISSLISEIKQSIQNLNEALDSNDVCVVFAYKSEIAKFRKLPPQVQFTLPRISSQEINTDRFYELFCHLSPLSILSKDEDFTEEFSEKEFHFIKKGVELEYEEFPKKSSVKEFELKKKVVELEYEEFPKKSSMKEFELKRKGVELEDEEFPKKSSMKEFELKKKRCGIRG